MLEDEFATTCQELGLSQFVNSLKELAQMAGFATLSKDQTSKSYLGGRSAAGKENWPEVPAQTHIFLGQVDCRELPRIDITDMLPSSGVLQFFSIADETIWDGPRLGNGFVSYLRDSEGPAENQEGQSISWELGMTLDIYEPDLFVGAEGWNADSYFELTRRMMGDKDWVIQCGGRPNCLQDNMEQILNPFAPGKKWVMLACFNGVTRDIGPFFGRYYFWMETGDLAAGRFENVVLLFQCE